jgi:hypothetical protein
MIEMHNRAGTNSYGCCRNMKEAQRILDYLKDSGEIPAGANSVTVCHYKNGVLQGVSEMEHRAGKWRPVTRDRHERISPQVSPLAA